MNARTPSYDKHSKTTQNSTGRLLEGGTAGTMPQPCGLIVNVAMRDVMRERQRGVSHRSIARERYEVRS